MFLQNLFTSGVNEVSKDFKTDDLTKSLSDQNSTREESDAFSNKLQKNIENNNKIQSNTKVNESSLEVNIESDLIQYETNDDSQLSASVQYNGMSDAQVTQNAESNLTTILKTNEAEFDFKRVVNSGKSLPVNSRRSETQLQLNPNNLNISQQLSSNQNSGQQSPSENTLQTQTRDTATQKQPETLTIDKSESIPQQAKQSLQQDTALNKTENNTTKSDARTVIQNTVEGTVNTTKASEQLLPLDKQAILSKQEQIEVPKQPGVNHTVDSITKTATNPAQSLVNTVDSKTNDVSKGDLLPTAVVDKTDSVLKTTDGSINTNATNVTATSVASNDLDLAMKTIQSNSAQSNSAERNNADSSGQLNQTTDSALGKPIRSNFLSGESKPSKSEFKSELKLSPKLSAEVALDTKEVTVAKADKAPIARLLGLGVITPASAEPASASLASTATQVTGSETYSPARMEASTTQSASMASAREIPLPVHVPRNIWNQRFAEHISMLALKGASQARIKLDPPELGPMMVRIVHGAETQIQFTVNNPVARDLVDSGMQRLRDLLEQQGFDQVNVDVREFKQESQTQNSHSHDFDDAEIAHLSGQMNSDVGDLKPLETYRESIGIIDIFA